MNEFRIHAGLSARPLVSGTLKILLTGAPGIGKTTVCVRVAERLDDVCGFITEEIREEGQRKGFSIRNFGGEQSILSHVDFDGPRVGKYGVDVGAMDSLANPELEEALSSGVKRPLIIDEIGKMELKNTRFQELVREVFESDLPLLATVPTRGPDFVSGLKDRADTRLIKVTRENREELPVKLTSALT